MPMLQWAAQKDRQDNVGNVAYLRASAQELPFADACFERVNCCGALHLFPDLRMALGEIRRVLKPAGRFTTGTFRKRQGFLGRLRSSSGQSMGVNCFAPDGLEETLKDLGFANIRIHRDAARWMILSGEKG